MTTNYSEKRHDESEYRNEQEWQAVESILEKQALAADPASAFSQNLEQRGSEHRHTFENPESLFEEKDERKRVDFFKAAQHSVNDRDAEYDDTDQQVATAVTSNLFAPLHSRLDETEYQIAMMNPGSQPDIRQVSEHSMTRNAVESHQAEFEALLADDSGTDHSEQLERLYASAVAAINEGVNHNQATSESQEYLIDSHDAHAANAIEHAANLKSDFDINGAHSTREILVNDIAQNLGIYPQGDLALYSSLERFSAHANESTPHWVERNVAEHGKLQPPEDYDDSESVQEFLDAAIARSQQADWTRHQAGAPEDWRTETMEAATENIQEYLESSKPDPAYAQYSDSPDEVYDAAQRQWLEANCRAAAYASSN